MSINNKFNIKTMIEIAEGMNQKELQRIVSNALNGFPSAKNIIHERSRLTPLQQLHIVIAPKYGGSFNNTITRIYSGKLGIPIKHVQLIQKNYKLKSKKQILKKLHKMYMKSYYKNIKHNI